VRLRVAVRGVVQGVGFRPYIYSLAVRQGLSGFVQNTSGSVDIEVEGAPEAASRFVELIREEAPPLAIIDQIYCDPIPTCGGASAAFSIRSSIEGERQWQAVPADSATCDACLGELLSPEDRRYRYPFINCTNCGPRFTIIKALPYDRPATTMAAFKMCQDCQQEYEDPGNRRFHAQPNACPACGPSLAFWRAGEGKSASPAPIATDTGPALAQALFCLRGSEILAIKGLGGFHLACAARDQECVLRLRQRKGRYAKPLAVMMRDLNMVRRFCQVSAEEEALLVSAQRPIVLLRHSAHEALPDAVSPGTHLLGVMLPYTPLHHLLLGDFDAPLVMTSGNLSEEPIVIDNLEALRRLDAIADAFLVHNREIESRYDDSVVSNLWQVQTRIRRSRGFAPLPIRLPFRARLPVLACGAHLKNTFCLIKDDRAFVSQHIGDLENLETLEHFEQSLGRLTSLLQISPELVAHDLHPDYLSTELARKLARTGRLNCLGVQHHHAHIVSCMVEHHLDGPVIGVAFDGTGYGLDGSLWGGEFLVSRLDGFQRAAHFQAVPMPGGSQAIKQPWRMALGYILSRSGDMVEPFSGFLDTVSNEQGARALALIKQQISSGLNCPLTSSCGRLFDAVSAILEICPAAQYEGQAAVELEAAAYGRSGKIDGDRSGLDGHEPENEQIPTGIAPYALGYPFQIQAIADRYLIEPFDLLRLACEELRSGLSKAEIAYRFHQTVARIILRTCEILRADTGIADVCLSGGVFQNHLLLSLALKLLRVAGFRVFYPRELPPNDGGLSLGQAVVALAQCGALEPLPPE